MSERHTDEELARLWAIAFPEDEEVVLWLARPLARELELRLVQLRDQQQKTAKQYLDRRDSYWGDRYDFEATGIDRALDLLREVFAIPEGEE